MTAGRRFRALLLTVVVLLAAVVGVAAFATPVAACHAAGDTVTIHESVGGSEISDARDGQTVFVKASDGQGTDGTTVASKDETVSSPNGGSITITLNDDGNGDDNAAQDGTYWGSFTITSGTTSGTTISVDETNAATVTVDLASDGCAASDTVTADYTAPQIASVTTADTNQDGDVDEFGVTFTENIDDSASTLDATTFTLGTGSVGSVATGTADDDSVTITLASPITGTSATPNVDLEAGKVADAAGNTLGSTQSFTGTTDGAKPVVDSGTYADTNADGTVDQVTLTFSETVSYSAFNADDWTVTANGLSGLSLDSLSSGSGTTTLTFGASATAGSTGVDAGNEPSVAYASGGSGIVEDQASTPNEVVDGSSAVLSDAAKPTVTGLELRDTAGDGLIDEVMLTFSEYVDTDDSAAPVAADIGTLTLPDGSTADLSGATVTDPAGSSSTVTVSSIGGQSTENTAAGSADVSGDLSANWVDASAGSNALVSTLDDETVTDSAAPVVTTAGYVDTSGDGTVDRIDVDYSEDVSASTAEVGDYSLGGIDASSVTLDTAATSGSAVRLGVTTSLSSPTLTLDYDAAAGTADSVTDGTNPAASVTGVSVTDGVAPTLLTVETLDRDGDGKVDAATLTFSEAVDDSSVTASDYSIGGQAGEGIDTLSTADDDTIQLRITTDANEVSGTDVKDVTYSPGSTADAAGNTLASVASGDVAETDGAAPVVTGFSLTTDATDDELDVSFDASESLSIMSVSISGPESATITSFSTSGSTSSASVSVSSNGDYTATLDVADDAAGNSASSVSDSVTVSFVPNGGSPSMLSDTSSRARVSGTTGLSEVGVRFSGTGAGTIRATELPSPTGEMPPGTFVSAVDITVPDSFTNTDSVVTFAISRERLDDLGVETTALTVYHRHDGSWEPLVTRVVDTGGVTVVVEADTPGFSQFALMAGGETSTQATAKSTSTTGDGATNEDTATDDGTGDETSQPADAAADGSPDESSDAGTTTSQTPGFGAGVALVALVAFLAVGLRRRG